MSLLRARIPPTFAAKRRENQMSNGLDRTRLVACLDTSYFPAKLLQ